MVQELLLVCVYFHNLEQRIFIFELQMVKLSFSKAYSVVPECQFCTSKICQSEFLG